LPKHCVADGAEAIFKALKLMSEKVSKFRGPKGRQANMADEIDDSDPIEKWIQELQAERPEWSREEGRRKDAEIIAKADALWEATGTLDGLSEMEWIRLVGALYPEEMREALLRELAESSPEERAKLKANAQKAWGH
jgi:hypothetical protein